MPAPSHEQQLNDNLMTGMWAIEEKYLGQREKEMRVVSSAGGETCFFSTHLLHSDLS